jgi:hypothetical protein
MNFVDCDLPPDDDIYHNDDGTTTIGCKHNSGLPRTRI